MSSNGKIDIHNRKVRVERLLKRISENNNISEADKAILKKFYNECVSVGLSNTRIDMYLTSLSIMAERFCEKDYEEMDKDDIKELVVKIEKNDDWSDWTKQKYRMSLRKLYQFLEGYEWNSKKYPEKVSWISTAIKNNNHKLPEEILTKSDIKRMIEYASTIRDKAFIAVLYESGCRIGEMLTLQLKNVVFDEYGSIINVIGKTGSRRIRLIASVPNLSLWVQNHPEKDNPNSFLWIDKFRKPLTYDGIKWMIKKTAEKAKITKKTNPHAFRHARATHLANKLTEAQMKEYFGWTQSSKMASVYVHLSGRDIDDAILKIYGKKSKEDKQKEIETRICIRCDEVNSFDSKYCRKCGSSLNEKDIMKLAEMEKNILNMITPEMIEEMVQHEVRKILRN